MLLSLVQVICAVINVISVCLSWRAAYSDDLCSCSAAVITVNCYQLYVQNTVTLWSVVHQCTVRRDMWWNEEFVRGQSEIERSRIAEYMYYEQLWLIYSVKPIDYHLGTLGSVLVEACIVRFCCMERHTSELYQCLLQKMSSLSCWHIWVLTQGCAAWQCMWTR